MNLAHAMHCRLLLRNPLEGLTRAKDHSIVLVLYICRIVEIHMLIGLPTCASWIELQSNDLVLYSNIVNTCLTLLV